MRVRIVAIVWLCCLALLAFGQNGAFVATTNKSTVSVNETFQITFTLTNADGRNFQAPPLDNFNKLGGPSRSTSMQINNGQASTSVAYSFYLQPQQEGTFTIAPAAIEVDGKVLKTNALTIKVTGAGTNNQKPTIEQQVADNVFLRLTVDKQQVYQGEQVTATFKLYTRMDIRNTSLAESPAFKGFWTQDLDLPANLNMVPEVYQGRQFNAAIIKKVALFPQRSGELEIGPMELETYARVQVEAPNWGNFFGRFQDIPYKFKSNSSTINVKPLPTENKPADFSGFVGSLGMNVSLDKTETETDDPITLSIRFDGTGNLRMLETPKIDLPKDFEVFDPKTAESSVKTDRLRGSKKYDFLIIPRRPGTFKLPPITVSYFDLDKKQYVTLSSDEYNLKVTGEASTSTGSASGLNKEEVELIGKDIRYIKTAGTTLHQTGSFFLQSWAFAGLAISPFLLFGALFAIRRKQQSLAGDVAGQRRKKATKGANRKLKEARSLMEAGEQRKFYDEVSRAIWGYLRDKLNIDPSKLSRDQVKATMQQHGVPQATINKTLKVLDDCEMAVYAPSGVTGGTQSVYDAANACIEELEEVLK